MEVTDVHQLSRRSFLLAALSAPGIGAAASLESQQPAAPKVEFIDKIVDANQAPDAGVKVELGPARPVMLAPIGDRQWGLFGFPSVWKLRDGRVVCAVTLGEDEMPSNGDIRYLWYISEDEGTNWTHVAANDAEAIGFVRERFTFPGGRQMHYESAVVSVPELAGAKPQLPKDAMPGLVRGISQLYRLGDLPDKYRSIALYTRGPAEAGWQVSRARLDPDILIPVFKEKVTDDPDADLLASSFVATRFARIVPHLGDARLAIPVVHKHYDSAWATPKDFESAPPADTVLRIQLPTPSYQPLHNQSLEPILEAPGGRLIVSAKVSRLRFARQPGGVDTALYPNIFSSEDGGKTWAYYSSVHYSQVGSFIAARAHVTPGMPAGNWVAAIRTGSGISTASCPLLLTRSYDHGHTWTPPVAIRPSSVNPVGGLLGNGIAFRMYGRPGQFITFCGDGEGKVWGNDVVLVPPVKNPNPTVISDEAEKTGYLQNSCCNSSVQALGPDRFLVAYTDYQFRDRCGNIRKAVVVRQVVARLRRTA
jgi:hypothetical protein